MDIIEQIPCTRCGEPMPKLRLTKYGYNFCVNCSDVEAKVGKIITYGTGDHTYNELQVLDSKVAKRLEEVERGIKHIRLDKFIEVIDLEEEDLTDIQLPEKTINKVVDDIDLTDDSDIYEIPDDVDLYEIEE